MRVAPLKLEDFDEIDPQPGQIYWRATGSAEYQALERARVSRRAITAALWRSPASPARQRRGGMCLGAHLAQTPGDYFLRFRGMFERLIQVSGKRRIFANTECDFADGCRWLEMLGFERIERIGTHTDPMAENTFYTKRTS
jgi:hypothetical protein